MYEEKRIEFDWKGFLIKLALLIVVIVLIIKLLPLNNKSTSKELSTEFKNNISTLRNKSNDYFNSNKLPSVVGESVKVSLNDLIKVGAIRTLYATNGDSCNVDDSYVKATKNTNDYELEVYLVCNSEKDTSYVYLNRIDDENSTTSSQTTTNQTTNNNQTTKKNESNGNNSGSNSSNNTKQAGSATSKITKTTTAATSVSVIFNSNGGSAVSTQYVQIGKSAARPASPTKYGYVFLGWYYNNNEYNFNSSVNANIILIAKWLPTNNTNQTTKETTTTKKTTTKTTTKATVTKEYKVTFDSNGGTKKSSQIIESGDYASKPSNPTRANATFAGWYLNNKLFNFNTRIYENITLVAKYYVTETYTTDVYSAGWGAQTSSFKVSHTLAIPSYLSHSDYENVRIKKWEFIRGLSSNNDIYNYERLHKSTFEYQGSNADFTSGSASNLATINYATIVKSSSATYNRGITWTGTVSKQCSTPFNYLTITNACLYGIYYQVTWEYEIFR